MIKNDFEIGVIVKPQGIKGELRVFPTTDEPDRFSLLDEITVSLPDKPDAVYELESSRLQKNLVIIKLKNIDDRNTAEYLSKGIIKIPPEKALPLDTDEYYIRDLVGMRVLTDNGDELGTLKECLITGANDVYVIKMPDGKDVLLPAIKECILSVSIAENTMTVHVMDGLLP